MSKISKAASEMTEQNILRKSETVTNFMDGESYKADPLTTLKMVTASSIFGEPSYYRDSKLGGGRTTRPVAMVGHQSHYCMDETVPLILRHSILDLSIKDKDAATLMEEIIDNALDYDFKATLDWAIELRNKFNVRLNPQVIMVRAAIHPKRKDFTKEHPGYFNKVNQAVMSRADDGMSQISYYLYNNKGKKNNIPSLLKRSWSEKFSGLNRYSVAKYKNHDIGMINAVRICHANSAILDELMQTGTVQVDDNQKTWENMRSADKSWEEIFRTVRMGHMAMLRNITGFVSEVTEREVIMDYMSTLKDGVLSGKQYPFRYFSAYKALQAADVDNAGFKQIGLDTLEACMDISVANMPKMSGRTMCLSDNSGSAWGAIPSEYGSVTVAEIDNLSSVITAMRSDEGFVGKFGDKLKVFPISKRRGVLEQAMEISKDRDDDVGGGTEGGIWLFFREAMDKHEVWDNIFIYSDQQAGTGALYGHEYLVEQYDARGYAVYNCINVFKIVLDYRKTVNKRVNVFSVQTAGYNNSILPSYSYRTNLLYGWTGKEAEFASFIIQQWDEIEGKGKQADNT